MKLRHELKYIINNTERIQLRQKLKALFKHDEHAGAHGEYRVRSLYFDDLYDKVLLEKLNGVRDREKFRIRYYNNDQGFIRLEKKIKRHDLISKKSAGLTEEQVRLIMKNDIGWMANTENELILELYSKIKGQGLFPKTIVEYIREPFVYEPGNVRITIDRELRTGIYSTDFLNEDRPLLAAADMLNAVLEVKYDEFLPDIVGSVVGFAGRRPGAYSKYAVCRRFD